MTGDRTGDSTGDRAGDRTTARVRLLVQGRVQGVFYRAACRTEADRLGVAGWARNLDDGRVEVVAEGEPGAVAALVQWCRHGPPRALVTRLHETPEPPEGLTGFRAR
jgi:acylphosphatase